MMAGVLTEGSAESNFGVHLSGFHAPVREFSKKLEAVRGYLAAPGMIVQAEREGYVTFLACENVYAKPRTAAQIAVYRREPHKFFSDLSSFLKAIRAAFVDQMVLTESLGSVQLTLLYHPAPGTDESRV